jgi:hypothetical protein
MLQIIFLINKLLQKLLEKFSKIILYDFENYR